MRFSRIISKKELLEGSKIPKGYGIAWKNYNELAITLYPIPLNWIFRWARDLYYFLMRGPEIDKFENLMQEAKAEAFRKGAEYGQRNLEERIRLAYLDGQRDLLQELRGITKGNPIA